MGENMYNNKWADIPEDTKLILERLDEFEKEIFSDDPESYKWGEDIVDAVLDNNYLGGHPINVIPGGESGVCHPTLLVAIGARAYEDIEKRILQAVEHIYVNCSGKTRFVLFWAAKWDLSTWKQHEHSFKGVTVILKPFGGSPSLLT